MNLKEEYLNKKEEYLDKSLETFKANIQKAKDFAKIPISLDMLIAGGIILLDANKEKLLDILKKLLPKEISSNDDNLIKKIFSDINIEDTLDFDNAVKKYIKLNGDLKNIIDYSYNELDNDIANELNDICSTPSDDYKNLQNKLSNLDPNDINSDDLNKMLNSLSKYDDKIKEYGSKLKNDLNKLTKDWTDYILPLLLIIFYLINVTKEYLTQNDVPSTYRARLLPKLIRVVSIIIDQLMATINTELSALENEYKALYKSLIDTADSLTETAKIILKSLDQIILTTALGVLLYELNKWLLQKATSESIAESIKETTCDNAITTPVPEEDINLSEDDVFTFDIGKLDTSTLGDIDICNINSKDNFYVPHISFDQKINEFTCEILEDASTDINLDNINFDNVKIENDYTTRAIYSYTGSVHNWLPIVSKGDVLVYNTPIMTVDTITYKSPLEGIVDEIDFTKKEIIVKQFSEPSIEKLSKEINDLQNLYQRNIDIKEFLKNFYIELALPSYLQVTKKLRKELSLDISGMEIVYLLGGVEKKNKRAKKTKKKLNKRYNKKIEKIASADNIEMHAKNETLEEFKNEIEYQNKKYYKGLRVIFEAYRNKSRKTKTNTKDFVLIDWYIEKYDNLIKFLDSTEDNKNEILNEIIKMFNSFILNRVLIDEFDLDSIKEKVNDLCNELDANFTVSNGDYYKVLNDVFIEAKKNTKPISNPTDNTIISKYTQTSRKIKEILVSKIKEFGSNNTEDNDEEKTELKQRIYSMFIISTKIDDIQEDIELNKITTDESKYKATNREANKLNSFFYSLFKEYENFDKNAASKIKEIKEFENNFTTYSIITRDNEEFRIYSIDDDLGCSKDLPYKEGITPYTDNDIWQPLYWLKYCGYATLASVVSVPTWSTGLMPPIGPLLLPTVYLPIVPFKTSWGVILLGLSITGLYFFPFIHVANLSLDYHVPFIDPASILKKAIDQIKKEIYKLKDELEKYTISIPLKKYEEDIERYTVLIKETDIMISQTKSNKPRLDREKKLIDKVVANAEYAQAELEYNMKLASLYEQSINYTALKTSAEIKWWFLAKALNGENLNDDLKYQDDLIKNFKIAEKKIDDVIESLDKEVAKINPLIASIPLSAIPGSSNFGFTLKSPELMTPMDDKVIDIIDADLLAKLQEPFELKNDDLMSPVYQSIIDKSYTYTKPLFDTLSAASLALIPKEPYPAFEKLTPINLPWTANFLLKSWVPAGSKKFGFPGFPQYPI